MRRNEMLVEKLKEEGIVAKAMTIKKNNVSREAVVINNATIYLDSLSKDLDDAIADVKHIIATTKTKIDFNPENIFNDIRPYVICKAGNEDMLDKYVYKEIEGTNLVCMFRTHVKDLDTNGNIATAVLPKGKKSADELLELATEQGNMKFEIKDVLSYILPMMAQELGLPESEIRDIYPPAKDDTNAMYYFTNRDKMWGAASLLRKDVIKAFADKKGYKDLYIIPSSIHEVLLLSADNTTHDAKSLKDMVCTVNAEEVEPEERLSDNVYLWKYDTNEYQIVC